MIETENTAAEAQILQVHKDRTHYINGGSVIDRRINCAGSAKMEEPFPDSTSEQADKGERVHEVIELITPTAFRRWDQENKFLYAPRVDYNRYSEEDVEAAKKAVLNVLSILGPLAPNIAWKSEFKLILDEQLQLGGTADFVGGYQQGQEKHGFIWDYKNGVKPVDAKKSNQLPLYAVALEEMLGNPAGRKPFHVVHTHIYNPNSMNKATVATSLDLTQEDLKSKKQLFLEAAKTSLGYYGEEKQTLNAGEHCFFCKAKTVCAEHTRWLNSNALQILTLHDEKQLAKLPSKEVDAKIAALPDPSQIVKTLSDEQIKNFWLHKEYILSACKAVDDYIKQREAQHNPIAGLMVVQGSGRTMWQKEKTVLEIGRALKEHGIDKPWVKELINYSDAKKELIELGKTEAELTEIFSNLTTKSKPSTKIVLEEVQQATIDHYNPESAAIDLLATQQLTRISNINAQNAAAILDQADSAKKGPVLK